LAAHSFEVYAGRSGITDSTPIATSQVALPEATCKTVYGRPGYEASAGNLSRVSLADDNVFGDDSGVKQLGTVTGDVSSGTPSRWPSAWTRPRNPPVVAVPGAARVVVRAARRRADRRVIVQDAAAPAR
jgi:hypothetical protein